MSGFFILGSGRSVRINVITIFKRGAVLNKQIHLPADARGLIFDCDGTLVDSMPAHNLAWRKALQQFGVSFEESFFMSLRGLKDAEIVEKYNNRRGLTLSPSEVVHHKKIFFRARLSEIKPITPVVDLVHLFHGRLPMAVVSGNVRELVDEELELAGIGRLFSIILTADDPYPAKPHPQIFLEAARRMQVPPQACVVFEDGDSGIKAARAAGMMIVDVREYL